MNAESDLENDIHVLKWGIDKSVRYHERRQAFYERTDAMVNALNLIFGSGAVLALTQEAPGGVIIAATAIVAVLSLINITMRSAQMASTHAQLKQRFIGLLMKVDRVDPSSQGAKAQLARIRGLRLRLEADEPAVYRVADVLAHNELAIANGYPEDVWDVPWFKAVTANFIMWETAKLKKVEGSVLQSSTESDA